MRPKIEFVESESSIINKRVNRFYTKEPDTIAWIDEMSSGEVLYDIGANIGIYSLYAASRGIKVYAFEPESQNFAGLTKNIWQNKLDVKAYCISVSDQFSVNQLFLSQFGEGHSMHSFGQDVDFRLNPRTSYLSHGSIGMTVDELTKWLPIPDYLKIDVDGLEHRVISGARKTLGSVKSFLIELNTNLPEHNIEFPDFTLVSKNIRQGAMRGVGNHIYKRK